MKVHELDCEGGCPFRDEQLCHIGPPCFRDPPCAFYSDDKRDVEDIINEIWDNCAKEEARLDKLEKQRQEKEAKKAEIARKRRESNWETREERAAIRSLKKRIQGYEAAIRLASSIREVNSMFGGIDTDAIAPASERQIEAIAHCNEQIAVLEQARKEKLKALRRRRKEREHTH